MSESSKSRRIAKAVGIVSVVAALGAVLMAKSWTAIPYNPTDGKPMFLDLNRVLVGQLGNGIFGSGDFDGTTSKTPVETVTKHYGSTGRDRRKVCIGSLRMIGRLDPPFLGKVLGLIHLRSKANYEYLGMVFGTRNRGYLQGTSLGSGFANELLGGKTIDIAPFIEDFKNLEPNDRIRINDDIVFIQCNEDLKIYKKDSLPKNARAFIQRAVANTPDLRNPELTVTVRKAFQEFK